MQSTPIISKQTPKFLNMLPAYRKQKLRLFRNNVDYLNEEIFYSNRDKCEYNGC
jgi:hypothetical protein